MKKYLKTPLILLFIFLLACSSSDESEPNEVFTLEWNYKTKKSAFDGLRRKPLGG